MLQTSSTCRPVGSPAAIALGDAVRPAFASLTLLQCMIVPRDRQHWLLTTVLSAQVSSTGKNPIPNKDARECKARMHAEANLILKTCAPQLETASAGHGTQWLVPSPAS
jgi:hypothetical protein